MKAEQVADLLWMGFSLSCAAACALAGGYGWAALNLAVAAWHVWALDVGPDRHRGRP